MRARKSAAMFANACGFDPGNSEDTLSPMKAVVYNKNTDRRMFCSYRRLKNLLPKTMKYL